jgi:hypothetical protein
MKFNVCTLLNNGFGLEKDYEILRTLLESWGHEVHGVSISGHMGVPLDPNIAPEADVNIFLELISFAVIAANKAKQNWFVPNQEWYHAHWDSALLRIDKILCKTQEAVRVFGEKGYGDRCVHVGWESKDLYDPAIPRQRKFLHVAGGSAHKNTLQVAYAFAKFFYNPFAGPWNQGANIPFILVSRDCNHGNLIQGRPNCTYIGHAGETELKRLMNECMFHIIPSGAEGWGHVIHEPIGCGNIVVTTDFPPMNEFRGCPKELLVCAQKWEIMNQIGRLAWVSAYDVKSSVDRAWRLTPEKIKEYQIEARKCFLEDRESFRNKLKSLVSNATN